jgi:beta-N-acetylhexosaminidase
MTQTSIAQSAGQVIVAGFSAHGPSEALRDLARSGQLAGFVLFRRNLGSPREVAEQNRMLRELAPAELPLWIAVDQEGGRVARLGPPVLRLPPMRVLGTIDSPELTTSAARVLGRQLALLGFNLDFAPVLDVDTQPANPVIGDRSFARDPAGVIRHARAFAAGLADAGIAGCGKHFPGHGDTLTDSHFSLPRLPHTRERVAQIELAPFAALSRELPCMMTAHVLFEAIDAERPASLSRALVTGLLREQLGFEGIIFSDDLEMKAVSETYGVAQAACLAIEAGSDQVLVCHEEDRTFETHAALIQRAERDRAFEQRLHDAARRSQAARRLRETHSRAADVAHIERRLAARDALAMEQRIQHAHSEVRPSEP